MRPRDPFFFFSRTRHPSRAAVVVGTALLALSGVAPPVAGAEPEDPGPVVDTDGEAVPDIDSARRQVSEILQKAADTVTGYREAEDQYARVEDEIAGLEAEIPRLRAEVRELERLLRNRAVEAYVGRNTASATVLEADNLVDASRRARLIDQVNRHDHDIADELTAKREELERREEQLKVEQEARKEKLEAFDEQAALLSSFLVEAHAVLQKAKILEVWDAIVQKRAPDLGDGLPLDDAPGAAAAAPQPDLTGDPGGRPVITDASVCPIAGPVYFSNDWGNPRSGGRTHKGTDVFAKRGTPNVAVDDGVVRNASGGLGGIAVDLVAQDNTRYYYAHLDSIEPGVIGTPVEAGDVLGYTGSTGNASPHGTAHALPAAPRRRSARERLLHVVRPLQRQLPAPGHSERERLTGSPRGRRDPPIPRPNAPEAQTVGVTGCPPRRRPRRESSAAASARAAATPAAGTGSNGRAGTAGASTPRKRRNGETT